MYIPSTFFSTQGSCITATTTSITGSGLITTGSFISGGYYWQYYQFEMSDKENSALTSFTASLNILSGSTGQAKILIVGGGGTGAQTGNVDDGSDGQWEVVTTGGGGAGGVVYYDNFPLSSGSYTIGIGKATSGPGGIYGGPNTSTFVSGLTAGKLGQPSWIKLPNNFVYTPFSNSYLVGYGGGGSSSQGSYDRVSPTRRIFTRNFDGQSSTSSLLLGDLYNGSGGGGGNVQSSTIVGGTPGVNGGMGAGPNGGLNGVYQGNTGGLGLGGSRLNSFCIDGTGVGGGGGGAAGGNRQLVAGGDASSGGGNGAVFNLTGTPTYYAGGGGGAATGGGGATGRGLGDYGCGGNGSRYGNNMNGQAGVVIVAWPICASTFSCKTFNITGSTGTLSYLPCTLPYTTQSVSSNPQDFFSACLLTWSGSNIPVLLEGETTASVGGECDNRFTQSFDCNCQYIRAVAGSGTQTLTYFPCNGSGSLTTTVGTGGTNFCIEYGSNSPLTGVGSTITYYGNCKAGTICTGVQYTSSIVNCSSVLATAGGSGGTLTYLPCGASASVSLTLSGSESMSICAGLTSSFLALTGINSTLQTLGACSASFLFPYSIIQNCSSSVTASAQFSGNYYPATGFTFISTTTGAENCWSVIGTASLSTFPTYTNVITQSAFADCITCLASSPLDVDYLLVAGGGGGGGGSALNGPGAGGGAGGLLSGSSTLSASNTYSIVIGTGGNGGFQNSNSGSNGLNSSAFGLTAIGGGGGGGFQTSGSAGGSGGGAGARLGTAQSGSLGTSGQGNIGGAGGAGSLLPGGGGGGASSAGTTWTSVAGTYTSRAGDGGSGSAWLNGNYYAGGGSGGGAGWNTGYNPGIPGIGGGGTGGDAQFITPAISPAPNTGAGGGGGASYLSSITTATSGSTGIAIIRYAGTGSRATGGTITYSGSYTYHTFTASGNFITN